MDDGATYSGFYERSSPFGEGGIRYSNWCGEDTEGHGKGNNNDDGVLEHDGRCIDESFTCVCVRVREGAGERVVEVFGMDV
jgi:hypothetical protein